MRRVKLVSYMPRLQTSAIGVHGGLPYLGDLISAAYRVRLQRNNITWYTCVHVGTHGVKMETLRVGIREFRDKLASYLLESDTPVAITRHGDTVGYYIPARRKRSETDRAALQQASVRWQQILASEGISEEDALKDFQQWRGSRRE